MILLFVAVIVLLATGFALVGPFVAWKLVTSRQNRPVGKVPSYLHASNVSFVNTQGDVLRGWFSQGRPGKGVVVLMHGHMNTRRFMVGRARFLVREGFSVLVFDFRAHGISGGRLTSFGYVEKDDADAAIEFARKTVPGEKIGLIAVSMGAAAALLSRHRDMISAEVIEIAYPRLEPAIVRRIKAFTGIFAPLFTRVIFARYKKTFSVNPPDVRPMDFLDRTIPRLFIAGAKDPYTTLSESRELFEAAAGPKEFWVVPEAGHSNIYRIAPREYERRVASIFEALSQD